MSEEPELRINKKAAKDAAARMHQCMDQERLHIRLGTWRGPQVDAVTFVGHCRDLHGTVCTCCPRRDG